MLNGNGHLFEFEGFRLDASKKVLWRDDEIVRVTPKAVELLIALVQRRGDVLTRDEMLETVWQGVFVEEANINFTISNLRKALGPEGKSMIETVPRRGYRFTSHVRESLVVNDSAELLIERHAVSHFSIEEEEVILGEAERHAPRPSLKSWSRLAALGAGAVLLTAAAFWLFGSKISSSQSTSTSIQSVAILPLRSIGTSSDDASLSFGLIDALKTQLGKLGDIRVITVGGSAVDNVTAADTIGRRAGVDAVLDGTLQRENERLRVTLRLIRSSDGVQVWSDSFDETEIDLFGLQDRMALRTANALARTLRPNQIKHPTQDREAYHAYLRGRFYFDKRNSESYEKAAREFERAISLDPKFALAYSGLADTRAMQANITYGPLSDSLYEKARTIAVKAVELDETSAEAHTSLGWIKRVHDWDWTGAEAEFRRAIELDPNYVNARQWYSYLLLGLGRGDEALAEMEKARDLAPLSKPVLVNYFSVRLFRGEDELLPQLAEQIAGLDEAEPTNTRHLTMAAARRGDYERVVRLGETFQAHNSGKIVSDPIAVNMAVAYSRTGQTAKANEMLRFLAERARNHSESKYRLAQAYAEIGRRDEAIALLETCFQERDDRMVWLKVEPSFESVRGEARFKELLKKLNLPSA